jgi:toxin ParE1/3/4
MRQLRLSALAESDLAEIWAYIARDNPAAANAFLARLEIAATRLLSQPFLGKPVSELASNLRLIPVGRYLLFYRPGEEALEIVRVLHGARKIGAELFKLF